MFARSLTTLALGALLAAGSAFADDWADAPAITTHDIHFMSTGVAVGDAGFYASLSTDGTTWTSYDPGTTADLYGFVEEARREHRKVADRALIAWQRALLASRFDGWTCCVQSRPPNW